MGFTPALRPFKIAPGVLSVLTKGGNLGMATYLCGTCEQNTVGGPKHERVCGYQLQLPGSDGGSQLRLWGPVTHDAGQVRSTRSKTTERDSGKRLC